MSWRAPEINKQMAKPNLQLKVQNGSYEEKKQTNKNKDPNTDQFLTLLNFRKKHNPKNGKQPFTEPTKLPHLFDTTHEKHLTKT